MIQDIKLPMIKELDICGNSLNQEEDALERLLKSCQCMPSGKRCMVVVYKDEISKLVRKKYYKCLMLDLSKSSARWCELITVQFESPS